MAIIVRLIAALLTFFHADASPAHSDAATQASAARLAQSQLEAASLVSKHPRRITAN